MPESPADPVDEAYQNARTAIAQYRLPDARMHLAEATRRLNELPQPDQFEPALRIRLTESWLIFDDLGLEAALDQILGATRDAEKAGRDDLRGLAHIQAGVLNARAGYLAEALQQMRLAAALAGSLPVEDRVRLLINKGAIGSQAGELHEAAVDLRTAASLADELPEYGFMATHNLGFVEYLRGDLPAALRWMAAADDLETDVDRSVSRLDRARVLLEVGLVDDANALLLLAVETMRASHLNQETGDALLELARCALLRGDQPAAARAVNELVDLDAGGGGERRDLEARLLLLQTSMAQPGVGDPGHADEAAALMAAAEEAGLASVVDRCSAWWVIAAGRAGKDVAEPSVVRRLRRMRRSPYLATRALAMLAQLGLSERPEQEGRILRAAASDVATARAGMSNLDLRSAVAIHITPLIEVDVCRAVSSGDAYAAVAATERWRTALESVPSVLPPADPVSAGLWSTLRQRHEDLRVASPVEAVPIRAEVKRMELRLRERSWTGATVTSRRNLRRPGRKELGAATVLNYIVARDAVSLVVLRPGHSAQLLRLCARDDLVQLVSRVLADVGAAARVGHSLLAAGVWGSLTAGLGLLEEVLLPESLGQGPVVVVPGEELAQVPWGMFSRLRHRPVTVSRSLTSWHAGSTHLPSAPRVAVMTGPGLELAQVEADAVCRSWEGATLHTGEPATVAKALTSNDIVHIAAHGVHRADNPLFSSVRLHNGSLFAHELEGITLASSMVVLSACSAGRAELRPGDEALGLTSSLLAMGVGAVVAPLTDVPDAVACTTMAALHERLAAGEEGPAALAAASEGLLARSFTWFGSNWKADSN